MPRKSLPRLRSVRPARKPYTLHLTWQDGTRTLVDITGHITTFRLYKPLRGNRALFNDVHLGEHGTDIVWHTDIDMSADTLWRLAQEQSGETLTPAAFRAWRERKAYTLDSAAKALGLSRRMVAYYESGDKPIPRVVTLATRALEPGLDAAA